MCQNIYLFTKNIFFILLSLFLFTLIVLILYIYNSVFLSYIITILPVGAFIFAVYQYYQHNQYLKKKDTFEYIDKVYHGKLMILIDELNQRLNYLESYYKLSIDKQLEHKENVKKIALILTDLNKRIELNQLSKKVLFKYFENSKSAIFLSFHMHMDITFCNYSVDIDELYKKFFEDFEDYEEKRKKQREYIYNYYNEYIKDHVKLTINEKQLTYQGWISYANQWLYENNKLSQDLSDKEEFLDEMQKLKKLYSTMPNFYLIIGNFFAICDKNYQFSLSYIDVSISLDPNCIPCYISLLSITFEKTKSLKDVTEVFDKIPNDIASNDEILFNYATLHAKAGELNVAKDITKKIKNKDIKNHLFQYLK